MGAWGTAILSDDVAADVYSEYMDDYDDGVDHAEIRAKLEKKWAEAISDPHDAPPFWFAVAKAQWKCGALEPDVLTRVTNLISDPASHELWAEQGVAILRKREAVLQKFLAEISTPNPKPRKRRKIKLVPAIFQPGDCLSVALPHGEYGAALVLAIYETRWANWNLVGVLHYKAGQPPPIAVFENRNWLKLTHHKWDGRIDVGWRGASTYKKVLHPISLIGNIAVRQDDPSDPDHLRGFGDWNIWLAVVEQFAWEQGLREKK